MLGDFGAVAQDVRKRAAVIMSAAPAVARVEIGGFIDEVGGVAESGGQGEAGGASGDGQEFSGDKCG